MFLLNSADSVTKYICHWKDIQTCSPLCKEPWLYHSTSRTQVTKKVFKLSPIYASVIDQISWIHWIFVPFRETLMCLVQFVYILPKWNTNPFSWYNRKINRYISSSYCFAEEGLFAKGRVNAMFHWRIQRGPPMVQILSFSCSFWQKKLKNNSTFGSWRILDPPLCLHLRLVELLLLWLHAWLQLFLYKNTNSSASIFLIAILISIHPTEKNYSRPWNRNWDSSTNGSCNWTLKAVKNLIEDQGLFTRNESQPDILL